MDSSSAPLQGARAFSNECENCIVSKGSGFSSFDFDCNCFIICQFVGSYKLSSMASPWIGSKRCCGCGASFSLIHLTCVNHLSKKSDCVDANSEAINPCIGKSPGEMIPREDPDQYDGQLCSGFITCVESKAYVGNVLTDILVPKQDCCPPDECFLQGSCSTPNCDNVGNTACFGKMVKDDCNCTMSIAPEKECPFMEVAGNVNKFMGVETMHVFDCPAGTCWDDEICNCVAANNTGYTDCKEFVMSEFDGTGSGKQDVEMTDGLGNEVYNENHDGELGGGMYTTTGNDVLNIVGTAGMGFREDFVFRIKFMLTENDGDTGIENQCLTGNCYEADNHEPPSVTNTFRVFVERNANEQAELDIAFTYLDSFSMVGTTEAFSETVSFGVGLLELDTMYTLWGIFCAEKERAGIAVYQGTEEDTDFVVTSAQGGLTNAQKILSRQSGIQLGNCRGGEGFEGSFDLVEFYHCKPEDDAEFQAVSEEIFP